MLNLGRLNVFQEVVERGSFSAAADALSYSQSAVSQSIATLEGELGVGLIERRRGGLRRTPAGAAPAAHGGRRRAASSPPAGAPLIPRAIAGFRASLPGVDMTLAEGEPAEIAP